MAVLQSKGIANNDGELRSFLKSCNGYWKGQPIWFRGHADPEWQVEPSAHREGYYAEGREQAAMHQFRAGAVTRAQLLPAEDDYFGWIALARHHNLRTRLLDWTQSLWVALYFATHDERSSVLGGAAIIALQPGAMHEAQGYGRPQTFSSRSSAISHATCHLFGTEGRGPFAACPPHAFVVAPDHAPRMLIQQAGYTLHNERRPLDDVAINQEEFVRKLTLSPGFAGQIRDWLDMIGVDRNYLYPSLDSLGLSLNDKHFWRLPDVLGKT